MASDDYSDFDDDTMFGFANSMDADAFGDLGLYSFSICAASSLSVVRGISHSYMRHCTIP